MNLKSSCVAKAEVADRNIGPQNLQKWMGICEKCSCFTSRMLNLAFVPSRYAVPCLVM